MSVVSEAGVGGGDLSLRTKIVNVLPTALFVLLVVGLLLSGAPNRAPSAGAVSDNLEVLGIQGVGAVAAGIIAVSVALQPFEMSLIRFFEGYWPATGAWRKLGDRLIWLQSRRWHKVRHAAAVEHASPERVQAVAQVPLWPQNQVDLLPTVLGNRLRAMERRAGRGFGLDAVQAFPRLYLILPDSALAHLNESRNQLDASVRFTVVFLGAAVGSTFLVARHGLWLLLPLALVMLSLLSYRASVAAATHYGSLVSAAFVNFHLKLLDDVGIERPADTIALREVHAKLTAMERGSSNESVRYARPP